MSHSRQTTSPSIRPATEDDRAALLDLAVDSGLFPPEALGELGGSIDHYFEEGADEPSWIVLEDELQDETHGVAGAAFFAPEPMTDGTWNLYFIAVRKAGQGGGRGSTLLEQVEARVAARDARVLIIETSGLDGLEATRRFYRKHGYSEEARIRDFYAAGDDKVVFWKSLG